MRKVLSFTTVIAIFLSLAGPSFAQRKIAFPDGPRGVTTAKKPRLEPPQDGNVRFAGVGAVAGNGGVIVDWTMEYERGNVGFNVYRIDSKRQVRLNEDLVFGSAAKVGSQPLYGERYSFVDYDGGLGSAYYIETLDLEGRRSVSPAFSPKYDGSIVLPEPPAGSESRLTNSEINLPKDVIEDIESQNSIGSAAELDIDTHRWVLTQPGVRIGVKKKGLHRVTRAQLEAAGFNVNSNSANWQLYVDGVQQAILIGPNDSYIEFIGKGIDTRDTDMKGYFLIAGPSAGLRMENYVARPSLGTIVMAGYDQTFEYKERMNYVNSILNGEAENFWGNTINATGRNFTFDLTGVDFSNAESTLEVKVQGFSGNLHTLRIILNGQTLQPAQGVAQFPFSITQTIPTSLLKDAGLGQGTNTLNLASIGPSGDLSLFDTVRVTFRRKHIAQQNTLDAYASNLRIARLSGFASANTRVFDTSIDSRPRLITNLTFQQQGSTFGVDLPASRGRVFFAVEDSAILSPDTVSAYDTELLAVNTQAATFVVIAQKSLLPEAAVWASYRQNQGFSTKVVDIDEVFNEFNYGSPSPYAIKNFLNYAYDNWQTPPQYVLLIGDAHFNSRGYMNPPANNNCPYIVGTGPCNLVPTAMIDTLFSETGSDEFLADFNNDGLSEIAIGRIPAREAAVVTNALAKVTNWEANLVGTLSQRGALFAFDVPSGYDFQAMSGRLRDELPAGTPAVMVSRGLPPPDQMTPDPNAQSNLIAGLNNVVNSESTGRFIVNYSGHGSSGAWASTSFFWNGTVSSLTNHNKEALFTMLTCLNGFFFGNPDALAEVLLKHTDGGAVAAWASTGLTTPDIQEVMGKRFYNQVGAGQIPRLGDLIKDAKSVVSGGRDVRLSWALVGDPMLKVN